MQPYSIDVIGSVHDTAWWSSAPNSVVTAAAATQLSPASHTLRKGQLFHALVRRPGVKMTSLNQALPDYEWARRVHSDAYLEFLRTASTRWSEMLRWNDLNCITWHGTPTKVDRAFVCENDVGRGLVPAHGMIRRAAPPASQLYAQSVYHQLDRDTPITARLDETLRHDLSVVQQAVAMLVLNRHVLSTQVVALTSFAGQHAGSDSAQRQCYLNYPALAAAHLLDSYAQVGILHVGAEHPIGVQDIHATQPRITLASIHVDPEFVFPHVSGRLDDTTMINYPVAPRSTWKDIRLRVRASLAKFKEHNVQAAVVIVGLDTVDNDFEMQSCRPALQLKDYAALGWELRQWAVPKLYFFSHGPAVNVGDLACALLNK